MRRLGFILFLWLAFHPALAPAPPGAAVLQSCAPSLFRLALHPRALDRSTPDIFSVVDTANEDEFFFSGSVTNGDLQFGTQTRFKGDRSVLNAKELFPMMLAHFDGRFERIVGRWQTGHGMTKNLDTFNLLTRTMSPEAAALRTWTGRLAAENGYTKVEILETEGRRGNYTRVKVAFSRPR